MTSGRKPELIRIPLAVFLVVLAAFANVRADTTYLAVDKFASLFDAPGEDPLQASGETVILLGSADSTQHFVRLVTVDPKSGARIGSEAVTDLPANTCFPASPRRLLYSQHVLPGQIILVGSDFGLAFISVQVGRKGSVSVGSWICMPPPVDSAELGVITALAELPGSASADGQPRLLLGTEAGYLIVLAPGRSGEPVLEQTIDLLPGISIHDIGPVPRAGGAVVGIASGSGLTGLVLDGTGYSTTFRLHNPTGRPIRSFRILHDADRALPDPASSALLAYCDGYAAEVLYARIPGSFSGEADLDTIPARDVYREPPDPDAHAHSGALVLLTASRRDVLYRPGYTDGTSMPGCRVNLTDGSESFCARCPVELTGDVDGSGLINSSDIIYLINATFRGGTEPVPCVAGGDVNCSGEVSVSDLIYLVNHAFKGGPPPCNVCALFAGLWTCP